MPQEVTIGDVFQVTCDARLNGQQDLLTFHYQLSAVDVSDPIEYSQFCLDMFGILDTGLVTDALADVQSVDVTYVRWVIQRIWPIRLVAQYLTPRLTAGAVVDPALPQNVSVAVTLRGDIAARTEIATKHIGGVPDSSVTNGMVNVGPLADYEALADSLLSPLTVPSQGVSVSMIPIIFHRDAPGAVSQPTSRVVGRTSRVDRRRTVGVGS